MKKFTKVPVTEAFLEALVQQHPDLIEPQLKYLTHQTQTSGGRLDVLLSDNGSFVVAELKKVEDDGMLLQGLTYFDYVTSQLEGFARLYKDIDPSKRGRLLLIAPSFSQELRSWCKWIDLDLTLVTYQCLRFEDDPDVIPIFTAVDFPEKPPIVTASTLDEHFGYITDPAVQAQARALSEEVKTWKSGTTVEAVQSGISIKWKNKLVAYLRTQRKSYSVSTYDADGKWTTLSTLTFDLETIRTTLKNALENRSS